MNCIKCKTNSVFIKKHQLCKKCYSYLYNHHRIKTLPPSPRKTIKNARKRHGINFIKALKELKVNPDKTLTDIGSNYNITRERVRQIFNQIYVEGYTFHTKQKSVKRSQGKEKKAIAQAIHDNDPAIKLLNYKKGGSAYAGAIAEFLFVKECQKRNYKVEVPANRLYDIIINKYKIDVKSTYKRFKSSNNQYYKFTLSSKQIKVCDFFACYIAEIDSFLIIPNKGFKESGKSLSIYIEIPIEIGQYYVYLNNFTQLE